MKTFLGIAPRQTLDRAKAWNCVIINQLATPGLGTLLAGRWLAGTFELALAVAGFVLIMGAMWRWFAAQLQAVEVGVPGASAAGGQSDWLGLNIFVLAWLLAGVSSWRLLREAKQNEANQPPIIVPPDARRP